MSLFDFDLSNVDLDLEKIPELNLFDDAFSGADQRMTSGEPASAPRPRAQATAVLDPFAAFADFQNILPPPRALAPGGGGGGAVPQPKVRSKTSTPAAAPTPAPAAPARANGTAALGLLQQQQQQQQRLLAQQQLLMQLVNKSTGADLGLGLAALGGMRGAGAFG
eukprot:Opistho-1_new@76279